MSTPASNARGPRVTERKLRPREQPGRPGHAEHPERPGHPGHPGRQDHPERRDRRKRSERRGSPCAAPFRDPPIVRAALIGGTVVLLGLFVALPIAFVIARALGGGLGRYLDALGHPDTVSAASLTLLTTSIVTPVNAVFGVAAAWLVAKFQFRGQGLLLSIFSLPFSISPVVAGLSFVLLFGRNGYFGPLLTAVDTRIIFAVPGVVIATSFVTFPFVVREVLPVMESLGSAEEENAMTLGAGPWQVFFRITLPKIKWGLLHGALLTNARAMGEFGAVSVVSGHVRGETNTLPLHAEILYNEYNGVGAFAVASLLLALALATVCAKKLLEGRLGA